MARPTVDPAFDGVLSMLDNAAAARREVCGGGEGGARGAVAAGGCMGGQVVRPFVTLCFAQSVDGSIAPPRGYKGGRLVLSGDASMHMTHRLRAWHDGILVGVGTVLADNPSLTVRLCEGTSPRPIVVDKDLRTPLSCRLMSSPDCLRPILVAVHGAAAGDEAAKLLRQKELEEAGAAVLMLDTKDTGKGNGVGSGEAAQQSCRRHVSLSNMLERLGRDYELKRIMIEGGAGIITSFLRDQIAGADVLDGVNVTTAPVFVGGTRAWSGGRCAGGGFPRLSSVLYTQAGEDMVMQGLFRAAGEGN